MGVNPVGGVWTDSAYGPGSGSAYPLNLDALFLILKRWGQAFNPHQSATPAMTIAVDPGMVFTNGALTEVALQTTGTITAPVSHPRIDRVVRDVQTGTISVITGTEAVSPTPPAITSGKVPVAQVLLQMTSTVITNSMITDERVWHDLIVPGELPSKASPTGADLLLIGDAAAGNAPKTATATSILALAAGSGGFVNKFRNPGPDVWQRGTSGTSTTAGTATACTGPDGWYIVPTGASVTWSQVAGLSLAEWALQITGAASVTDVLIKQRIEGSVAAPLAGQQVTVQLKVFNNTGGSITPTLTVKHATALDNWGATTTDVSAVSLQACANGATTTLAYTFASSASSLNGLEVTVDFGNNFSSSGKTIKIGELDIRVTAGLSTGLNAAPPTPELRPIAVETAVNQRYFFGITPGASGVTMLVGIGTGGSSDPCGNAPSVTYTVYLPVVTRVPITGITTSNLTGVGSSNGNPNFQVASISAVQLSDNPTAHGPANPLCSIKTATSAGKVWFTGAEL